VPLNASIFTDYWYDLCIYVIGNNLSPVATSDVDTKTQPRSAVPTKVAEEIKEPIQPVKTNVQQSPAITTNVTDGSKRSSPPAKTNVLIDQKERIAESKAEIGANTTDVSVPLNKDGFPIGKPTKV